ncbi:MAG: hypothetical protein QXO40_01435 [Candidatus Aenigmatarchaeota archaeon]
MVNKKIEPDEVLLEGFVLKLEDLKEIEHSIESYKKDFKEKMREIGTIRNYLRYIGSSLSEEGKQKLENIISEFLKRYSIENKKRKSKINIDTNLIDLNSKEFYNLRKFVKNSMNSFIYEIFDKETENSKELETNIEKYLTCFFNLYKYLELLTISRIIYRFTLRDFYIKEAILKVGSEERFIDNDRLRKVSIEAITKNNIEYSEYINNLREREMAFEIMKSVKKLKRKSGRYRTVVIVGASHAKTSKILKNYGIKNVRLISNLYMFDLYVNRNKEYYENEYAEFLKKSISF